MDNMKQQMSLFEYGGIADDGMTKDPVSGNKIPPGSLAKEVRDDVPAMLSEGEYVIPADVLRFYGVNFFEKLRNQAKNGLQQMEQNGRIGGTPMTQQDVARNMQQQMAPMQAAQGAMIQQTPPKAVGNSNVPTQGYAGEDGSIVSRWTPSRARWSSPMFQGTSSQQRNIEAAQAEAEAEEITQFRNHYNQEGESVQIKYVGTDPANMVVAEGQDEILSQYPLTEEEWAAYKKEIARSSGDDGGDSTPPEETSSAGSDTSWMEGIDFSDTASVKKWAQDTLAISDKASIVSGMGILGAIPQTMQGQDIAKVRAVSQFYKDMAKEFENPEEYLKMASFLEEEANKTVKNGSVYIRALDKLKLITGNNYHQDLLDMLPKSAINDNIFQKVTPANTTVTQEELSNLYSDDGQPSLTTTTIPKTTSGGVTIGGGEYVTGSELPKSSSSSGGETTKTVTTSSGGTGTVSATPVSSEVMAAGGVYNEGGLMAKNKAPKKKTRKYNKGGLADKK